MGLPESFQNLPDPVMEQVDHLLEDFDSNGNGYISVKEVVFQFSRFSEYMSKVLDMINNDPAEQRTKLTQERWLDTIYEMIDLFRSIDTNGDGALSVQEVKNGLMDMLPESFQNLPDPVMEQVVHLLEDFDSNSNGYISVKEVVFQFSRFSEYMGKVLDMINNDPAEQREKLTQERWLDTIYEMIDLFRS